MKKVKLSLNKTMIARLNGDEQSRIQGGEGNTLDHTCHTKYPLCAWSGCWGAASCTSMRPEETCGTMMTENVNCGEW